MSELSDRLKSLRKTSGLSLARIGKATGHSKAHMWELETGKTLNPRLSTLRSLAKFYGMTIDELLSCQPPSDFVAIVAQLRPLFDQHFQAGLKRGAEARLLIQEARDTIHACNRQIITQEARFETRALLDRALRIIDGEKTI